MKVLQINASYKPAFVYGGPTMSVSMLCEQLALAGAIVDVFTTTANGSGELPVIEGSPQNIDGVTVTYFKRITGDHTHFSPSLLIRLWQETKHYDVVHIHAWWNLVSVLSCLVALMRKVPVIVSTRGTLSPYSFQNRNKGVKSVIHKLLGEPLLNRCHLHVTSAREQRAILDLIRPIDITDIPNLVKLSAYNVITKNEPGSCLKLIFLSRIEEKKGFDILFNALPMVSAPYHLTIAGSGDDNYINHLKQLAKDNQIEEKISWAGFHDENKFDLLSGHDLFVLPSYDENFGNAVIESLSMGTAVLISEHVGLADYVEKNELGWLCETDAVSISAAINKIADGKTDPDRIRKQAPGIIYNDFDPGTLVQKYMAMYNQVIDHDRL